MDAVTLIAIDGNGDTVFTKTEMLKVEAKEGTTPTIDLVKDEEKITTTDGETTYAADSLVLTVANHKDAVQIAEDDISTVNANFGAETTPPPVENTSTPTTNVTHDYTPEVTTVGSEAGGYHTLTLKEAFTVSKELVDTGYTLALTGVEIPEIS